MPEVAPDPYAPDAIAPGDYLRRRRRAAGLSIAEVAAILLARGAGDWPQRILDFELGKDVAGPTTIEWLRSVFRFDPGIYANLVAGLPAGQICRECACSWHDACIGVAGNCHWAEADLCSACARKPILAPPPTFQISAEDPFAVPVLTILGALHLGSWAAAEMALAELTRSHRNALVSPVADEKTADAIMRSADDMVVWRKALGPLPKGEPVHV